MKCEFVMSSVGGVECRLCAFRTDAPVDRECAGSFLDCTHRGDVTRLDGCESCGGNVRLKVYECQIHGECVIAAQPQGIKCCTDCGDFTQPLPS